MLDADHPISCLCFRVELSWKMLRKFFLLFLRLSWIINCSDTIFCNIANSKKSQLNGEKCLKCHRIFHASFGRKDIFIFFTFRAVSLTVFDGAWHIKNRALTHDKIEKSIRKHQQEPKKTQADVLHNENWKIIILWWFCFDKNFGFVLMLRLDWM